MDDRQTLKKAFQGAIQGQKRYLVNVALGGEYSTTLAKVSLL
jgi:hypothetical protein